MRAEDFLNLAGILQTSTNENSNYETNFTRGRSEYIDLSKKFHHVNKDFSKQYYHVYAARLSKMKGTLIKKATLKWGKQVPIKALADLQVDNEKCIIIGTLFKCQELKPSILKEISEEFQLLPQQKITHFVSDKDRLVLEDELQRIKLLGKIDVHETVTGIVCAVLGFEDDSGKFHVEDMCWCGPQSFPREISFTSENRYLVLISGIDLAHNASLLPLQMFVDWLVGWLGEPSEQENVSRVAHVIFAGNMIRGSSQDKDGKVVNTNVENASDIVSTVKQADDILSELTESMEVHVMPGEFDPTNYAMPQQPIHYCMFPKAWRQNTLHSTTNPYSASLGGRLVLGTSGQPIDDIGRYSNVTDPIKALESTLQWGHLAPTSPDTLCSYPYYEEDPFIIEEQPHILFAGNQEKFQTKVVELNYGPSSDHKTCLVCIPKFSKTGTCALINLATLDCTPVSFKLCDERVEED